MNYRPDIDGLRAVAVLPVIFFHAGFEFFSGGFVGVDVFFVISGFLITGLIARDLETSRFSILEFYERRARRILPALFFITLCTLPVAWVLLLPVQFKDFSQALVATAMFASNIWFWKESGYFAAEAETIPFLHTWSLGVEEQFYVIAPILLMLVWRTMATQAFKILCFCMAASFIIMEVGRVSGALSNDFLFYWPVTRAWEIFMGACCALWMKNKPTRPSNLMAFIGICMIFSAIFTFDENTVFPSFVALLPTIGTVLVLVFSAPETLLGKFLSNRIFVSIGLISYSLYLWHNPIFVFARAASLEEPSTTTFLLLSALSVALAYGTWRFIEAPARVRKRGSALSRQQVFGYSALGLVLMIVIGVAGHRSNGIPSRFSPQLVQVNAFENFEPFKCNNRDKFYDCVIGDREGTLNFALLGDSHANRYAVHLQKSLHGTGIAGQVGIHGLCPPLVNFGPSALSKHAIVCRNKMQEKIRDVAKDNSIRTVVLASEWAVYPTGTREHETFAPYGPIADNQLPKDHDPIQFQSALIATAELFIAAGKRVIIISPLPEYEFNVTQTLQKYLRADLDLAPLDLSLTDYRIRNADFFDTIDRLRDKVIIVDPTVVLCDKEREICRPYNERYIPLTADSNHLSPVGADIVGPLLIEALQNK